MTLPRVSIISNMVAYLSQEHRFLERKEIDDLEDQLSGKIGEMER